MRTKTPDPSIDLGTRGKHTVVKRVHQNSRLCRQVGIIRSCSRFNSPGVDHDRSSCANHSHTSRRIIDEGEKTRHVLSFPRIAKRSKTIPIFKYFAKQNKFFFPIVFSQNCCFSFSFCLNRSNATAIKSVVFFQAVQRLNLNEFSSFMMYQIVEGQKDDSVGSELAI